MTRQRRPTITTVAEVAEVSIASASRALNGIHTNPDTRARVLAAAEQVGYMPHAAARSLRSRQSGLIAFAMHDIANPVYSTMVSSIQQVASEAGLRLILHSTGADAENELAILRDLGQRFVDGLILSPIVVTDRHLEALRGQPRRSSSWAGCRATSRGHGRGRFPPRCRCRDPAPALPRTAPHRLRQRPGGHDARAASGGSAISPGLRSVGLGSERALIETAPAFTADAGRLATTRLLSRACPTRSCSRTTCSPSGGLGALREAGRFVPDEVAVVGHG